MSPAAKKEGNRVAALRVNQWLSDWNSVDFSSEEHRRRPQPYFYLFKLRASWLKALSGISRRSTKEGTRRFLDLGIQRRHDEARSSEIHEFVRYGYPWSELSAAKRESGEFDDLQKPGWLPTAIVVNILTAEDKRRGSKVAPSDLLKVGELEGEITTLMLPTSLKDGSWSPSALHPIEVIDGQHRLWAFTDEMGGEEFEFPVVAFHGLDISWQAYLFWTINIKPKRINASLAFDLYPLLRTEDWLEKFEGHSIYRETRAQELTEALWAIPQSPWHMRINMLGESGTGAMVTQAAWIRSLMATFIKTWEGRRIPIGGLFGSRVGSHKEVLPWSRAQQAAFLIFAGGSLKDAVEDSKSKWARVLRETGSEGDLFGGQRDPAFYSSQSLLATDQGIRVLLSVLNDFCYVRAADLRLQDWSSDIEAGRIDEKAVGVATRSLKSQEVAGFLEKLTTALSKYDWRTSSASELSESERTRKATFRGGGGYKELRQDVLRQLATEGGSVGKTASEVSSALGYRN